MKILWHSNAPWVCTGYGQQTQTFIHRLAQVGHQVKVSAFYGLQGAPLRISDDIEVLPVGRDLYGNDVLEAHQNMYTPDVIIGLMDIWVIDPGVMKRLGNFYNWTPVDHDPAPPAVVDRAKHARGIIAMSRFGEAALKAAGIENVLYVPHGVDSKVFKPHINRDDVRRQYFGEQAFVVGMFMANKGVPSRKAFDQQIRAFARFRERHPEAVLYMHTHKTGFNGENLPMILAANNVPVEAVRWVPEYEYLMGTITGAKVAEMMSACDVVMNATRGEGFGIPIVEAQMCGTPVIVTKFSAMPELCKTGWMVEASEKVWTPQGSYQAIPSIEQMDYALEQAYIQRGDGIRQAARDGVMDYDADNVLRDYWLPVLETIQAQLSGVAAKQHERKSKREALRTAHARQQRDRAMLEAVSEPL